MWARRNPALAVSICAIIAVLSYGVVAQQIALRQAHKARADAEKLIEFMDKELADKLRPLGRLDLTGDVIRKAEAYFQEQDEANSGPAFFVRKASFFWRAGSLERDLGKIPEAHQMAIRGLATLDRLEARHGSDAEAWGLRGNLELLLFRVAKSYGRTGEAREHGKRAIDHEKRALEMKPDSPAEIGRLAEILLEQERFHRELGENANADGFLGEAVDRLTSLARSNPRDLQVRRLLAITHYHKGLAVEERDKTSALASFKAFTAGLEEIAHEAADDRDWQYELAIAYARAASAHYALHDYGVCEALVEKWRVAAEKLSSFDPNNVLWRASLAQSLAWSGLLVRDRVGETDPRVGHFFEQGVKLCRQLIDQNPIADSYYTSLDDVVGNLVRFYKATTRFGDAEEILKESVNRHWQSAARFPARFGQHGRLRKACEKLLRFLEDQSRQAEAASLCQEWIREVRIEASRTPGPNYWAFAEAVAHGLAANLATKAVQYDLSAREWRDSLRLLQTLTHAADASEITSFLAYAFESLISVQEKRRDLPGLLAVANEGLDWLENGTPKTPQIAIEFCQIAADKALLLDPRGNEVASFLERCRKQLHSNSPALEAFDEQIKNRFGRAQEMPLSNTAGAPSARKGD